jgi:hypothetical protein
MLAGLISLRKEFAMIRQVLKYLCDHKDPQFESEEQKCAFVVAKYAFSFSLMVCLALIAYEIADSFNKEIPLGHKTISIFQWVSIFIAATGYFGQPGWKIQTWNRKSRAEQLDEKISLLLSVIGFFLSFLSFHLIPG